MPRAIIVWVASEWLRLSRRCGFGWASGATGPVSAVKGGLGRQEKGNKTYMEVQFIKEATEILILARQVPHHPARPLLLWPGTSRGSGHETRG